MRCTVLLSAPLILGGCFTAELDPAQGGAFACSDDPGGDCPEGMSCINRRCEINEPPSLEIRSPEALNQTLFDPGKGATVRQNVTIGGVDLELEPPGSEHVFGHGHIDVFVDGKLATSVTSGGLSGGIDLTVDVPNIAGAHRVALVAVRNDNIRYDNEDAAASRLFWLDDGLPHVGIQKPWDGASFGLGDEEIALQIAVINFKLEQPSFGKNEDRFGHVHLHYDISPSCFTDAMCDANYIGVAVDSSPLMGTIPETGEKQANIIAVLRHRDHTLFEFQHLDGSVGPAVDAVRILRDD